MPKFREEVLNVTLAQLLETRNLPANAETVTGRSLPDVLIRLGGLKLVLEGRRASARASLLRDTERRVADGIADISMALLYDDSLFTAPSLSKLKDKIEKSTFEGSVFHLASSGVERLDFTQEKIDGLAGLVRNAFAVRVQSDVVREHVAHVETMIERIAVDAADDDLFSSSDALLERLARVLGEGGQNG